MFLFASWLSLLLFILLCAIPLLLFWPRNHNKCFKFPPGPPRLPIIGNLLQLGRLPHRSLWHLSQKYGPLMYLELGSKPAIVVSSAKLACQVLKTHDLDFCNRPAFLAHKKLSYDSLDVFFTPFGDHHREMRKIVNNNVLSVKRVQSFDFIRSEEVARMIASVSRCASSYTPANLTQLMFAFTSSIVRRAAFGIKISFQAEEKQQSSCLCSSFETTQAMLGALFVTDYIPWLGWIDVLSGQRARLEKCFGELDAFYEEVIEEHANPKRIKKEGEEDIVDVLLQIQEDHHLTRNHIKALLMNVLIGGTDTSATTVVWAMTELIKKPGALKKAQDEIRKVVGNKGKVEEKDLYQLQYLKSVVMETFRVHPAAPLLITRETARHCKLDGYDVAPKTLVFINAMAIGQDVESWENPTEFLPERFMDGCSSGISYKGQDFQLIPFGAGRRICPGMNFAVMNVELALANLLYCFDWELPPGMSMDGIGMSELPGISVHKKSPLLLVPTTYISPSADGN